MVGRSQRYALAGYSVWMTILILSYFFMPGARIVTWGLIGISGVVAILAGIIRNRPQRVLPWLLLAAANLSFASGQLSFLIITSVLREHVPFPSFVDVFYLLTYPLYAVALVIFIRWRTPHGDRRSLLDALTLTAALALVLWLYLILPNAASTEMSWVQKCFAIAYPLGDVLVLAMLARLLAPGPTRGWPVRLLAFGTIGLLASDVPFGLIELHGTFHSGTIVDLGWAFFYSAWGAAALIPSMAELTRPVAPQQAQASRLRLTVLLVASLVAPTVLLIQSLEDHSRDDAVIAVFSAILYVLVLMRLRDVVASNRRALDRERAVRRAGARLASAITVADVATAVIGAAATLLDPRSEHEELLAVREEGGLRPVGAGPGDAERQEELGRLTGAWLPRVTGSGPILVEVSELDEEAQALLPKCDGILLCPLALHDRPSGDPLIGVLAVFGEERNLADLLPTLEILAQEAALAIERVMLSREVLRQGNEAYFRTLVQDAADVIMIVDGSGQVRYATPSVTSIFGSTRVTGAPLEDLVDPPERDKLIAILARTRHHAMRGSDGDWKITRRDGTNVHVHVRFSDLRDDPTVSGVVLTLRDVTQQRQLEEELKHQAFHDALTGLPNRQLFGDRAGRALVRARRTRTTTAVLFVDLDDFKVVNDTMGHGIGDELLVAAGARLADLVRDSDTASRLGGDEFALLLEDLPDANAAEVLAERVVQAFGEPFTLATGKVLTTATVGVSAAPPESPDAGELLRHADLALYAAKAAGKRRWRRYQPAFSAGLLRRRELQAAIEEAVNNRAFTIAYQPIATLATGELVGFEALVRWPRSPCGTTRPDQFIPIAEETGQIVPLGAWVLERAMTDVAQWQRRSPDGGTLHIGVNVSARQFRDPGFVQVVRRGLDISGLAPTSLILELTESVLLHRDQRIYADLRELKGIGIRLAIDDFGTGYSSLSYLRELPMDVLKIDKSFVDGIAVSRRRLAITQGIVGIAKTLRLQVIAEGIETEVQRELLIRAGCELGQGYLLARPLRADKAAELVRAGHPLPPVTHAVS
jgi:diguanylate cyclase (GGDEF)-like protein/PAS domain S-box-containing protein